MASPVAGSIIGWWPRGERSRIARRRNPKPQAFPAPSPNGNCSQPSSSGPRCTMARIIARTAGSTALPPPPSTPAMPHMGFPDSSPSMAVPPPAQNLALPQDRLPHEWPWRRPACPVAVPGATIHRQNAGPAETGLASCILSRPPVRRGLSRPKSYRGKRSARDPDFPRDRLEDSSGAKDSDRWRRGFRAGSAPLGPRCVAGSGRHDRRFSLRRPRRAW